MPGDVYIFDFALLCFLAPLCIYIILITMDRPLTVSDMQYLCDYQ